MRILLTGPTGFIGGAFARLAVAKGHQIAGLVIPSEQIPAWGKASPGITWLRGTLEDAPWKQLATFSPECCVHTAWITTPGVYLESPDNERFRDHSLAFLKCAVAMGVKRVVALGTCIEYQITNEPLSEKSTPIAPATIYARCKNELRIALETEARQTRSGFCWARVFYPYGPGEHPSRLCTSIIAKLRRGEPILLRTPGSTKDYIYIEDLAAALLAVTESTLCGPVNLGTGQGHSVSEIAGQLGTLLGRPELVTRAVPPADDPFPFVVAEVGKLRSTGWQQAWPLRRGLEALIAATS